MSYPAHSILSIDMSPFGQSLALIPAMRAVRAAYPTTLLVAAASNGTCELLSACGIVDETIGLGVIKSPEAGLMRSRGLSVSSGVRDDLLRSGT